MKISWLEYYRRNYVTSSVWMVFVGTWTLMIGGDDPFFNDLIWIPYSMLFMGLILIPLLSYITFKMTNKDLHKLKNKKIIQREERFKKLLD